MNIENRSTTLKIVKDIIMELSNIEATRMSIIKLTKPQRQNVLKKLAESISKNLTEIGDINRTYECFFDGSVKPNPGRMKISGSIRSPKLSIIYSYSDILGYGTNNEAGYNSLIKILSEALKLNIKKISLYGDSPLVINQINLKWKCKDNRMKDFKRKVWLLLSQFQEWKLENIKQKFDTKVDLLTR